MATYCEDCGAPIAGGGRVCADEAACAERSLVRYGGDTLVARAVASEAPRDGETLGVFEFNTALAAWIYTADYDTFFDCAARADSLSRAFGVPFEVRTVLAHGDAVYLAVVGGEHTAALRAALAPVAAPAWDASDEAAHVAETVDELRRR